MSSQIEPRPARTDRTTQRATRRPTSGPSRPVYTRLQVLGLLLIAGTVLAVSAVIALMEPALGAEALAFFGPVAAVTLLTAWFAWRSGTWARIVGLVVGVAAAVLLSWTLAALAAVDSVVDFGLSLGVTVGVVLAIAGGGAALVSGRRGRLATAATPVEQRIVRGVVAGLGLALAVSATVTLVGRSAVDPAMAQGATSVEMVGFEFHPGEIVVDSASARLRVRNADAFLHDLSIPEVGTEVVRVTPGATVTVDLQGVTPGTYVVYCTLHSEPAADEPGEDDMTALLVVR
jgi:plastocyanin